MKGVGEDMARGKRVEIVKVTVTGPDGTAIEADGKACTKCGEVKALDEFCARKVGPGGRDSACRVCSRVRQRARLESKKPGAKKYTAWTTSTLKEKIHHITEGEYELVGDYLGYSVLTLVRHLSCGEAYRVKVNNFLQGKRCPHCFGTPLKTTKEYEAEVKGLVGGEYCVVGDYINAKTDVVMYHTTCGNPYRVRPNNFLSGYRCPHCAESRGERSIREYLTTHTYVFTPQYKINECHDINPLPFDFAVHFRNYDVLIEYDGEQHSHPVDFAGKGDLWALEQFRETQRRDRIKDDYCRANGIQLIRIDYTQFDEIETILEHKLSALGVTGSHPTEVSAERMNAA